MSVRRKRWTAEDDDYVLTMYGTGLTDIIAERLGRSEQAVRHRAVKLGIARPQVRAAVESTLVELDGSTVSDADVLKTLRIAAGFSHDRLTARSGYYISCDRHLGNPRLRKMIDVAGALGFDLVLRRRA